MGNNKGKLVGIIIVLLAFFLSSINSILTTGFNVLDTDPSTYIIVVMLMIFLFGIFYLKEDIKIDFKKKNVAYSLIIFAFYVILLSFLRVSLSTAFMSFRIDALLFPLILLSLIVLVFGPQQTKKFYLLIIFSAFASPLILTPILKLNYAFANLNASLVYGFAKAIGAPVYRIGLVILSNLGTSITISTTCVSLGTFIAFIMFLIPVAYFYDGKIKKKVYWLISGVLLVLILNFLRMLLIALIWVFYGIGSAINTFHLFAGQFIFYISIIIMVLLAGKFGLSITIRKKIKQTKNKERLSGIYVAGLVALLLALITFFLNLGYGNAIKAPGILFGTSGSNILTTQQIIFNLEKANGTVLVLGTSPKGYLFAIMNHTQGINSSVLITANTSFSPFSKISLPGSKQITMPSTHLLKNGVSVTSQIVESSNATFEINYFSKPYNVSGNWTMINYIFFKRISQGTAAQTCNIHSSPQNYMESVIYDAFSFKGFSNYGLMCQSYRVATS